MTNLNRTKVGLVSKFRPNRFHKIGPRCFFYNALVSTLFIGYQAVFLALPGVDLMNRNFGRKVFGQTFIIEFCT
jgi:hypothetical protein